MPEDDPVPIAGIFDCVPKLLKERKWFDVSLDTILRDIDDGKRVDLQTVHQTLDETSGEQSKLPLRLRVSGTSSSEEGWHIMLLLYNRPIDGFGYEARFCDIHGVEQTGWHRHIWNHKSQGAADKVLASMLDKGKISFRDFLIRTLKEMKISYPKDDDYANPRLL